MLSTTGILWNNTFTSGSPTSRVVPLLKHRRKPGKVYRIFSLHSRLYMPFTSDAAEFYRGYILFLAGQNQPHAETDSAGEANFLDFHGSGTPAATPGDLEWKKHVLWHELFVHQLEELGTNTAVHEQVIGHDNKVDFPGGILIPIGLSVAFFALSVFTTADTMRAAVNVVYQYEDISEKLHENLMRKYTALSQSEPNPGVKPP